MIGKYIDFGCGMGGSEKWRCFDASFTLRYERMPIFGRLYTKNKTRFPAYVKYGDIVKGLPIKEGDCDGVYCSHVLEHLSIADFRLALKNVYDYLKPGGTFRLVVPDLEKLARRYTESNSPNAAEEFMRSTGLGKRTTPRTFFGFIISWFRSPGHLWMWDFNGLKRELENVGFKLVRRASFQDSGDENFLQVEKDKGRWVDSVGIECSK